MTRPTIVNSDDDDAASGNAITFGLPTLTEGNRMIVIVGQDGSDSIYTAPAGWSSLGRIVPPTIQCSAEVFSKVVGASEPTDPQFTSDRTDAFVGAFIQCDNNAALDGAVQTASADAGAPDPASITPSDGETLGVVLLALDRDDIISGTMAGWTRQVHRPAGGSGDRATAQTWTQAVAGTDPVDPPALSAGDDNWAAMTLLLMDGSAVPQGQPVS